MNVIRQTALNRYETCAKLFEEEFGGYDSVTEYEDNDPSRQSKYSLTGIKFHEVMEMWGLSKMNDPVPMKLVHMHNLLDIKLAEIESAYYDDAADELKFKDSLHEQLDWIFDIVWEMKPLAVEENFTIEDLMPGLPPFTGTIDLIVGSLEHKDVTLADWKTGKPYTKNEMKSNMQACIYSMYFEKRYGFYPKEFVFYFTKHRKRKSIQITPQFISEGQERIRNIWMHILNKDFREPIKPNKYFCTHFCSTQSCRHKSNKWGNVGYGTMKGPS